MAAGLAAEIKASLGLESELIQGAGGIFLVEIDGKSIFSRHDQSPRRFPALGEIPPLIQALMR